MSSEERLERLLAALDSGAAGDSDESVDGEIRTDSPMNSTRSASPWRSGPERASVREQPDFAESSANWPAGIAGQRLLARAKAAIGCAPPSLVSLVATDRRGAMALMAAHGRLGEVMAPRVLRGEADGGVLVSHPLGERELKTAIVPAGDGRFRVVVDLGHDAAARRVRVTVLRGDREVSSENARQGRVMLPTLSAGKWRLRITESAGWLGDLDLELVSEAAK